MGNIMDRYPLIGVSTGAVVLLILGSLTNMIGYQTVQISNQTIINEEVNQRELLFQTIVDIANNKEIQKIAFNSETNGKAFFDLSMKFSVFKIPVLTENKLKQIYFICLLLSKVISKSNIHTMIEHYHLINQKVQKGITAVIEKDATLKGEITQLSTFKCDCENEITVLWHFPIICLLLIPFLITALWIAVHGGSTILGDIIVAIASPLHCRWLT
jgi:hypothetical protein